MQIMVNLCIPGDLLKENTEMIAFGMNESCSTHCAIPTLASVSKTRRMMATEREELFSGGFQKSCSTGERSSEKLGYLQGNLFL